MKKTGEFPTMVERCELLRNLLSDQNEDPNRSRMNLIAEGLDSNDFDVLVGGLTQDELRKLLESFYPASIRLKEKAQIVFLRTIGKEGWKGKGFQPIQIQICSGSSHVMYLKAMVEVILSPNKIMENLFLDIFWSVNAGYSMHRSCKGVVFSKEEISRILGVDFELFYKKVNDYLSNGPSTIYTEYV